MTITPGQTRTLATRAEGGQSDLDRHRPRGSPHLWAAHLLAAALVVSAWGLTAPVPAAGRASGLAGDTIENPIWIASLPADLTGETCSYADDYSEACPYSGSTSPDVVYAFAPDHYYEVSIDLCASDYDTQVYVYENVATPGSYWACDDDGCPSGSIYRSLIETTAFYPGQIYYIVVDGYGGECGEYRMQIDEYTIPCNYCLHETLPEGEATCYDEYEDHYNAGCPLDPPPVVRLDPSEELLLVKGNTGTYELDGEPVADRDVYEIRLAVPVEIHWAAWSVLFGPLRIELFDGNAGCEGITLLATELSAGYCAAAQITADLEPGRYWLRLAPETIPGQACDSDYTDYVFRLDGYTPAASALPAGRGQPRATGCPHLRCWPNPCLATAQLHFRLAHSGPVTVSVFDPAGRLIDRPLAQTYLPAGTHQLAWRPPAAGAGRVGCGLYLVHLETERQTAVQRLIRLE